MEMGSRARCGSAAAKALPETGATRCGSTQMAASAIIEMTEGPINLSLRGNDDLKPGSTAPPWNRRPSAGPGGESQVRADRRRYVRIRVFDGFGANKFAEGLLQAPNPCIE